MPRPLLLFISLCMMPLFTACSLFTPIPRFQPDGAQEQLARLSRLNGEVTTFKGSGSVVIMEKDHSQRFRIAWAGASPTLLRMEILAVGVPMESIAYDGKRLQLRSHVGDHAPYTKKASNPSLEPTTGIPLTIPEIHALLSGKFFVGEFKNARRLNDTLILRTTRHRKKTITLDDEGLPLRTTLTEKGKKLYEIRFTRKTTPDGINQFKSLILTHAKGVTTIRINRMIINPPIDDEIFTLNP